MRECAGIGAEMRRWLIAEWLGHWAIPDHPHGGVHPGPHVSFEEAQAVLDAYVKRGADGWADLAGQEIAEQERDVLSSRLQIVEVEWPEVDPDICNSTCLGR